ncbi:hypothetical protein PR202_ga26939 [Eleusine coracana subsp. coracana]|uniref:Uncharacterized protein n=1 Tax=Eleusine coracana subsp. coracana TaxID=191504 RepID=A0AAV5DFF5_ELECO|nr:hypothetical protein PR202_ga26939 [Eleusine coracana subsp. coracana]
MRSRAALEPLAEEPGGGEEDAARRRSGLHAALHRWARASLRRPATTTPAPPPTSASSSPCSPARSPPSPSSPASPATWRRRRSTYIIEQFRATTGCARLEEGAVKSMYASGKVRLAMLQDPSSVGGGGSGRGHEGSFVFWQLAPSMWLVAR